MGDKKVNILVTGATGFVGRHLVPELENCGHKILAIPTRKFCSPVCDWINSDQERLHDFSTDVVIHLGGLTSANDDPAHFAANVIPTFNLLDYFVNSPFTMAKPRFIYTSTINVYWNHDRDYEIDINQPPNPTSFYGTTKLMAEEMVKWAYTSERLSTICMRFCPIVGPGMTHGVFYDVLNQILDKNTPSITLRSTPYSVRRPFLSIETTVHCIIRAIDPEYNGEWNFSSCDSISLEEMCDHMQEVFGTNKPIEYRDNLFQQEVIDRLYITDDHYYVGDTVARHEIKLVCEKIKGTLNV